MSAETALVSAHTALVSAHTALVSAHTALVSAHTALVSAHTALVSAHTALVSAETALVSAETARMYAHAARALRWLRWAHGPSLKLAAQRHPHNVADPSHLVTRIRGTGLGRPMSTAIDALDSPSGGWPRSPGFVGGPGGPAQISNHATRSAR